MHKEYLIAIIYYADQKLEKAPSEDLIVRNRQGIIRYYKRNPVTEVETYIGNRDIAQIRALQEKAYYRELKNTAEKELSRIEKIEKIKKVSPSVEELYFSIPEYKRNLITPFEISQPEEIKKKIEKELKHWQRESNYRRSVKSNANLVTLNGEKVRSKSELIIADRLNNAGLQYFYEGRFIFTDKKTQEDEVWFPDFQILNNKTGEIIYWEHFGMMDNSEYCVSCQYKLETYAKYGIIQGKNLIVTFETSKRGLDTEYDDRLITTYLK